VFIIGDKLEFKFPVDFRENHYNCHQRSDFNVYVPNSEVFTALPHTPKPDLRGLLLRGRRGGEGRERERGKEGKGTLRKWRGGKERGGNVAFHHLLLSNLTTVLTSMQTM